VSEIDPRAIARELGFSGSPSVSVLAENRGKGVWRIEGDRGTFALRVLRPGEHQTALFEERAMAAAETAGAPAPRVAATATWEERPVMLLSWCEGQTLREAIQKRPWTALGLGRACGRAQARLHASAAPSSLAATPWITRFGSPDPELRRRLEAVERSPASLLHLDFHMDNVLVSGGEVTGLVDWTNACAGDARADLARTWSLLTGRAGAGARARVSASVWRVVAAGWHRGYEQVAGRQDDMLLFRIWALAGLLNTSGNEAGDPAQLERMRRRAGLPPAG
jgi:aminoglycoside phosphotransferase (APT) family kinase protein